MTITDRDVEIATEAHWNSIPCHAPWSEYDIEAGKEKLRACMRAALIAVEAAHDHHS